MQKKLQIPLQTSQKFWLAIGSTEVTSIHQQMPLCFLPVFIFIGRGSLGYKQVCLGYLHGEKQLESNGLEERDHFQH
jgi:hypothetical protein